MEESTHYGYVSGWLLPAGINVEPQPVLVPNDDIDGIVNMIGGNCRLFDCVSHDVADEDGNRTTIVGFVDDEGLYDPAADVNYLASAAFCRMEPLVGLCRIVVRGTQWVRQMLSEAVQSGQRLSYSSPQSTKVKTTSPSNNQLHQVI